MTDDQERPSPGPPPKKKKRPGADPEAADKPARSPFGPMTLVFIVLLLLGAWFALLVCAAPEVLSFSGTEGLRLTSDLLLPPEVPARFDPHAGRCVAAFALFWVWLAGNWGGWRTKEV